ncbi:hypothetical protein GCM10022381_30100 [Leifsonia kafniensis]|uniref:SnoaL-like domain-containing protein n=1 Tax=Leifsonia kafniensis TaxID=475957 RepID=A0ABP7KR84_9MICO
MLPLEKRIAHIEDQLAIYQIISGYGPSADSGSTQSTVDQWSEDGAYVVDGVGEFRGHAALESLFEGELHQGYIHQGSAHVNSLPHVVLDGDRAIATNYQHLYIWEGAGARVVRSVATRWEFERRENGWKVVVRANALLDGREAGRTLLGRASEVSPTPAR